MKKPKRPSGVIKPPIETRFRCMDCNRIHKESELLKAENPFCKGDSVIGCPGCKSINTLERLCEVDGCKTLCSSGWVGRDQQYHWTCHEHYDAMHKAGV